MEVSKWLPRDMGFWRFWWESIKHSFTRAWIGVLSVSGALAILVPCTRLLSSNPRYQTFFDVLEHYWTGWILIVAFFVILLARAAYAPFLIYREAAGEITTTEAEREELRGQLATERDTRSEKERVSKHIEAMSDLWAEGKRVLENLLNPDRHLNLVMADKSDLGREASDWYGKVMKYLQANGESDDANYFRLCDDGANQIPNPFESVLEKRNALCRGIQQRVRNLRVIIDRTKQP